jgi:hypothetical protein
MDAVKKCPRCTLTLPMAAFTTARNTVKCYCKDCAATYVRAYRARAIAARNAARVVESLPAEEWRPVVGGAGYLVSSLGRAKSNLAGERLLIPSVTNGYHYIEVTSLGRRIQLHRLVAEAFHGPPGAGLECDHIDRNRANNCAANLRWVTHAENMRNR